MKDFHIKNYLNEETLYLIIIIWLIIHLITSCKSSVIEKEVPIEIIKTEYKDKIKYDSIYIHDSISIYIKGDTVFKDKIQIVYKEKVKINDVFVHDSIEKPVYIEKTKFENKLNWFQKVLCIIGLSTCIFIITWLVLKIKLKFKL